MFSWLTDTIFNDAENGKLTGMILVKFFGTLDHKILLDKLKCTGFPDKAIQSFFRFIRLYTFGSKDHKLSDL